EEVDPGSGRVVLGFLHLLGRTLVPSLIGSFRAGHPDAGSHHPDVGAGHPDAGSQHPDVRAGHPDVRFTLVQGSRQDMLSRLRDGELDLVLVAPPPSRDPALSSADLTRQELVVSVPRGHRLATRKRVRLADLAAEDLVTLEHGYGLRQIIDDLFAGAGLEPRIAFESQESETVRGLVAAGFGVSLLPRVGTAVPEVVDIPLSPRLYRTIGLCWLSAGRPAPAVRAFRDHVLGIGQTLAS
ncbi:MAG: hypothetical protein HOY71_21540, partial [Nonomuraea sp.]|nr:hypothetical protein [Nonomuraea sp.]